MPAYDAIQDQLRHGPWEPYDGAVWPDDGKIRACGQHWEGDGPEIVDLTDPRLVDADVEDYSCYCENCAFGDPTGVHRIQADQPASVEAQPARARGPVL